MIPLRDENPTERTPVVVITLIAVNAAVFAYQWLLGPKPFEYYILAWGLTPAEVFGKAGPAVEAVAPWSGLTFMSSMFMHGGVGHILFNLWSLWIFGDNVEDAIGRFRFIVFYLVCGLLAAFTHAVIAPSSAVPMVGASGAIAGVLGAYFLLYPRHRILVLVFLLFFLTTVRVPAAVFLGLWFLFQMLSSGGGGNIAWFAHIGGFVAGFLLVRFFLPHKRVYY